MQISDFHPLESFCSHKKNAALAVFLFACLRFVSLFLLVSGFLRLKVSCNKRKEV